MKKEYIKPAVQVVKLQHQGIICTSPSGSRVTSVRGGVFDDIESDEGYHGGAR
jgi:hypothetical protein